MITLAAEPLTYIGSFPITNTLVDLLLVDIILIAIAIYIKTHIQMVPNFFQGLIELVIGGFYGLIESVAGKNAKKIYPYVITFLLFILISNWSGLLPVITNITVNHGEEEIPLIRSASTDLNVTLSFALVSLIATHMLSIRTLGLKSYFNRFFSFNPIALFTGILELISEFTKIISFSFRLFGNIFVGEVMLATLSAALAFIAPVPVILYELFVGIIQASIFALLTMAFMAIFTTPHGGENHSK